MDRKRVEAVIRLTVDEPTDSGQPEKQNGRAGQTITAKQQFQIRISVITYTNVRLLTLLLAQNNIMLCFVSDR